MKRGRKSNTKIRLRAIKINWKPKISGLIRHLNRRVKRAIFIFLALIAIILIIHLVYAAYSGTRRLLGPESRFENATATGTITIGDADTNGSLQFLCNDSPPTCNADTKGMIYCDDSESRLKLCDGTAWTAL